ncbi:hypothetical protein C8F01DRAFT_1110541 [Mycena amicta]|nr:hypothetical protein C8F01DRAFT_1110541 [Mycena amicta]
MAQRVGVERWTAHEDELLLAAVANFGEHDNWKTVALAVPGRTNKACRKVASSTSACSKRYREALDPNLKKDEWTQEEDVKLLEVYGRIGNKWGQVGQELRRSGLGCRNRHRLLERNRLKLQRGQPPVPYVYYPPESYPTALGSEHSPKPFRAPTPQMPPKSPLMPFNYSSSSLSAALSDPPRASLPLPPVPDDELISATEEMSVDEEPIQHPYDSPSPSLPESPAPTGSKSPTPELVPSSSASPTPATSLSPAQGPVPLWKTISPAQMFLKSPNLPPPRPPKPFTLVLTSAPLVEPSGSPPSPSKSPLTNSLLLSAEPIHVFEQPPTLDHPPIGRLSRYLADVVPSSPPFFSGASTRYPYTEPPPGKRQRRPRKITKAIGETRLSCMLPASSDPELRAYACGRESCWPARASTGSVCYSTSKELVDHIRSTHEEEAGIKSKDTNARPYKCALAGCGKSWKVIV